MYDAKMILGFGSKRTFHVTSTSFTLHCIHRVYEAHLWHHTQDRYINVRSTMPSGGPAPLFSSTGSVYQRRPFDHRSQSAESDDELCVDRSLPASPVDAAYPGAGVAGPSRAYRFAVEEDEILRHATEAFQDLPPRRGGTPLQEDIKFVPDAEAEELREIDDVAEEEGGTGARVEQVEDEEEPPDERQCRICFSGQEEEASLGRLISPCLCSGSMRVSSLLFKESATAYIAVCPR
jgi:hypothetical protein